VPASGFRVALISGTSVVVIARDGFRGTTSRWITSFS